VEESRTEKKPSPYDDMWYWYLTGEQRAPFPKEWQIALAVQYKFHRFLPGSPRCIECDAPMGGLGSLFLRPGSKPASFSSRFCSSCEVSARQEEAGAEVFLSMLFADVRDSTPLAESSGITVFQTLINKFYKQTSKVLVEQNAMVNRLMGDQVSALFVPRFAGKDHPNIAFQAAKDILRVTGHGQPSGPWVPVGVGIHTGMAFVGVVGSADGVNEIAVLGSEANLCARLSSQAAAGEILISEDTVKAGQLDVTGLERRTLELKGINHPVNVRVFKT
jgi:adenylate cyclase